MNSTACSVAVGRRVGGQEQQVDVAERRQHAAAVAAGGGDHQPPDRRLPVQRERVVVQRRDQPVGQRRQQPRRLQPGQIALLERVAHMAPGCGRDGGGTAPARTRAAPACRAAPARPATAPAGRRRRADRTGTGGGSVISRMLTRSRRTATAQQRLQPVECLQAPRAGSAGPGRCAASASRNGSAGSGAAGRRRRRGGEQRQRGGVGQPPGARLQGREQAGGALAPPAPARRPAAPHARPRLRPAAPAATSCRNTTSPLPFLHPHGVRRAAAAARRSVRRVRGNAWRKWCGSARRCAAPPAPPRRSPARPASRCRGRSRPPPPGCAARPGAGWRRSRSSPP